jgi:hypothetical protein
MHLKRGTVGEREKRMERKGGGGQYTANQGSERTGIAPQHRGGIPSKYEGSLRNKGRDFQAKEDSQEDWGIHLRISC